VKLAVNRHFVRQVRFFSEQSNISESYRAGSLYAMLSAYPTVYQEHALEKAVLRHHQTRRDTADCLCLVFEAT
jgi:hypothetical protein